VTRIYANPGFWRRSTLSIGVLILVAIYGIWELLSAARGPSEAATTGYMFGAIFFGGSLYALYQLYGDWRDLVATLDLDEASGRLIATLWQPQGPLKLPAGPGQLTNWRPHIKVGKRNARAFFMYADHAAYPRPLRFDLRPGVDISGLRRIAPEAIAEHDAAFGKSTV